MEIGWNLNYFSNEIKFCKKLNNYKRIWGKSWFKTYRNSLIYWRNVLNYLKDKTCLIFAPLRGPLEYPSRDKFVRS